MTNAQYFILLKALISAQFRIKLELIAAPAGMKEFIQADLDRVSAALDELKRIPAPIADPVIPITGHRLEKLEAVEAPTM